MPVTTICNNDGCKKSQEPYMDKKNKKIYCSECNKEITNLNHFIKIQMETLKQFKTKTEKSFSVKCPGCSNEDRPLLKNKEYCCSRCNKSLNLPHAFKVTLDAYLSKADKEI